MLKNKSRETKLQRGIEKHGTNLDMVNGLRFDMFVNCQDRPICKPID